MPDRREGPRVAGRTVWNVLIGRPLRTSETSKEEITPVEGLSALSLDALTSVAYGPEAIIVVLAAAGAGALHVVLPITIAIVVLLAILVFSYRQVIDAYPGGGGAYAVSRANLGHGTSLVAGVPSLDLNYMLLPDLKVRFDASRTLTRPPLNEITPTLSVGGRVGALTATGNNPGLLPYLSNNFDLGAEWYYGQNEYLAVDGFFKHVSQFPEQQTINVAINNVQDPTTSATAVWAETTFVNSPSANVYGAEIAWQKMLMWGFGYQLNGTIVHTNHPYDRYNLNTQFYLPGLADSANFVGFYQKGGFQARVAVNWTAEQLTATTQEQNGGAFGNEPTFTKAFTEVDFSTQYDFNDHLSVFFKALNLTNSEIVEHGRFSNQILNVQDIGRTFTMGVRAKL